MPNEPKENFEGSEQPTLPSRFEVEVPPTEKTPIGNEQDRSEWATLRSTDSSDARARSPKDPELGNRFGDYELIEEIARGGMGVVYKARQISLNRIVALKMILSGQLAGEEDVKRFYVEAEAAANLDHAGIVPIYEIGCVDGQHFFSMKLIEGGSLTRKLASKTYGIRAAVQTLHSVAEAVHHAHQRGILHRDLKPGNILLDEQGEPYVTDLGLAKRVNDDSDLTRTGAIVGTPNYMPPEQASGSKDVSTAADIYSLGAILYEMLTGRPPFASSTPMETLIKVVSEEPVKPTKVNKLADQGLELVCLKCLSKDPNQRYASASEFASELEHWLNGEPISVQPPSTASLMRLWMKQNFGNGHWIVLIGAMVGFLLSLLGCLLMYQVDADYNVQFYDQWPRVPKPIGLFRFHPPDWLQILLVPLIISVTSFMGVLIVGIVRPKNRDADFVAGLIAGVVATIVTYLFCFAYVPDMSLRNDTDMLSNLSQKFQSKDASIDAFLLAYPDLESASLQQQVDFLSKKIWLESSLNAPKVVWRNLLGSLLICLPCSIIEAMIAGHLFRQSKSRWSACLKSIELSAAFGAVNIMFGSYLIIFAHSGSAGGLPRLRVLLVVAIASLVIYAGWKMTKWWVRLPLHAAWIGLLVLVCKWDYPAWSVLATHFGNTAHLRTLIANDPTNEKLRTKLVSDEWQTAEWLLHLNIPSPSDALGCVERAEIFAKGLPEKSRNEWKLRLEIERSNILWVQGERMRALTHIRSQLNSKSDNNILLRFFDMTNSMDCMDQAEEWILGLKIGRSEEFNYFTTALRCYQSVKYRNSTANAQEQHEYIAALMRRKIDTADELAAQLKPQLKAWLDSLQTWRLSPNVRSKDETSKLESSLLSGPQGFEKTTLSWVSQAYGQGEYVDLGRSNESTSNWRYALARIDLQESGDYSWLVTSDGGLYLWFDGVNQIKYDGNSRYLFNWYGGRIPLGKHVMLLRISQPADPWGFSACFFRDGWPYPVTFEPFDSSDVTKPSR